MNKLIVSRSQIKLPSEKKNNKQLKTRDGHIFTLITPQFKSDYITTDKKEKEKNVIQKAAHQVNSFVLFAN